MLFQASVARLPEFMGMDAKRIIMRCFGLAVTVLVVSLTFGGDSSGNEVERAWRELFAQPTSAPATEKINAVLTACDNDAEKVKSLITSDSTYPVFKPGWFQRTTKVVDKKTEYKVDFFVRIPSGYTPTKSWPLIMVAHGTGGNGKRFGRGMELRMGAAGKEYVIVAPTLPGPKVFNARSYQEQTYLKSLAWVRRNVNIDDDRIYIAGYSQGGHITWHMATMYPRLFAAAVPMAGVPWFEGGLSLCHSFFENTEHLPIWAIWGEKDIAKKGAISDPDLCRAATKRMAELGNKNFTPGEVPGGRHGDCWPKREKFVKYLASHKRKAVPAKFTHFFHMPHHRRGYYVEALKFFRKPPDFSKSPRIVVHLKPGQREITPAEAVEHVRKHYERLMFRMWVQLDKKSNSLTVRASGIRSVRLYVMEGMFDPGKPVVLRWGRRTWRGKVPVSSECILTHYAATRDATAIILNEIDFDMSGKATVRFK